MGACSLEEISITGMQVTGLNQSLVSLSELKGGRNSFEKLWPALLRDQQLCTLHASNFATFTICHIKEVLQIMLTAEITVAETLLCSKVL